VVVIVEGIIDALVLASDYNVAAVMSKTISSEQARVLSNTYRKVIWYPDGDVTRKDRLKGATQLALQETQVKILEIPNLELDPAMIGTDHEKLQQLYTTF
jgi:DNA primase